MSHCTDLDWRKTDTGADAYRSGVYANDTCANQVFVMM